MIRKEPPRADWTETDEQPPEKKTKTETKEAATFVRPKTLTLYLHPGEKYWEPSGGGYRRVAVDWGIDMLFDFQHDIVDLPPKRMECVRSWTMAVPATWVFYAELRPALTALTIWPDGVCGIIASYATVEEQKLHGDVHLPVELTWDSRYFITGFSVDDLDFWLEDEEDPQAQYILSIQCRDWHLRHGLDDYKCKCDEVMVELTVPELPKRIKAQSG